LSALLKRVPAAATLADVAEIVARLPPSAGVIRREAGRSDALTLTFVPPIPATVLERALVLNSIVRRTPEGWVLRRSPRADEPGATASLQLGRWAIVPRLAEPPTSGIFLGEDRLFFDALDVITDMQIGLPSPPVAGPTAALASALLDRPPRTVGELCATLGIGIDGVDVDDLPPGRLAVPNLSVRFSVDEGPPATLAALHERQLLAWTVTFPKGIRDVDLVLAGRFGPPREATGARVYGAWIVRWGDRLKDAGSLSCDRTQEHPRAG
jgi:hypothetical protein